MSAARPSPAPTPGVGVVCVRGREVLLIKRAKEPLLGQWSIPGGAVEPGETTWAAALRELQEETGVRAQICGLIDVVDAIARDGAGTLERHYVLIDFAARWLEGEPRAGDDAAEAGFFALDRALDMVGWAETRRIIAAGFEMAAG